MIKSLFFTLFAVVLMASCSSVPKPTLDNGIETLVVGSKQATVDGKKLYIVKKGSDPNHWLYLYSGIDGFTGYQEGYEYELQTKVVPRTPTSSDVSPIAYVFVKEISKIQKDSKGMPGFSLTR